MRKSNFDLFEPLLFFQTNPHVTKYLAAHVKGAISEFFLATHFFFQNEHYNELIWKIF